MVLFFFFCLECIQGPGSAFPTAGLFVKDICNNGDFYTTLKLSEAYCPRGVRPCQRLSALEFESFALLYRLLCTPSSRPFLSTAPITRPSPTENSN
jgi:hypothetical protein